MRNKKFLAGIVALILILCLGIGYAAVSRTLSINGTTGIDPTAADDYAVWFTDYKLGANMTSATVDEISATFTTTVFTNASGYADVYFLVENQSVAYATNLNDITVEITDESDPTKDMSGYFDYTLSAYYKTDIESGREQTIDEIQALDSTAKTTVDYNSGSGGFATDVPLAQYGGQALIYLKIEPEKLPVDAFTAKFTITINADAIEAIH